MKFPAGFLWGSATSAHQVEGNNHNDWTEWEKLGFVHNHEQSGAACDSYHRWREDIALAKALGHNAYRFSIEWSRIEPRPGEYDQKEIQHYRDIIAELRRQHIEPLVSLHHFTLPVWAAARGGWLSNDVVKQSAKYIETVVAALGADVKYWVTVTEPMTLITISYLDGFWPPNSRNPISALRAGWNLLRTHRDAYAIIHRHFPNAMVGVAHNVVHFAPFHEEHWADRMMAKISHRLYNRWWLERSLATSDYIGLNYYFRAPLKFHLFNLRATFRPDWSKSHDVTDVGWEICPEGFGEILRWIQEYNKPVVITENGIADHTDAKRPEYLRQHIREVGRAIERGLDVRGYIHWALIDNFEWREGFAPRFGLVAVDYATQNRTPRPSAAIYRDIIQSNGAGL